MATPKLHELLAVHSNLETQLVQTAGQLKETFTKKHQHFGEKLRVFHSNAEGVAPVTEEQSALQTTVSKELDWVSKFFVQAMDVSHQIDVANQVAVADIVLDDEASSVLVGGIPATTLLELEKRLVVLQELFNSIPTLDPVKAFETDNTFRLPGVYKAREVVKTKTSKKQRPLVLYEATKEHAAQVQLISEDVEIGKIVETEWSGMISPADKSSLLERLDLLLRAVKQARSRANNVQVDTTRKIGRKLMDFLVTGKTV